MKIIKTGKYSDIVWMKKGEDFLGTLLGGQKQGFYQLWTGNNRCCFNRANYLGPHFPSFELSHLK
jgi:hypothetical protein